MSTRHSSPLMARRGGIGRHSWLAADRPPGHAGSNPAAGISGAEVGEPAALIRHAKRVRLPSAPHPYCTAFQAICQGAKDAQSRLYSALFSSLSNATRTISDSLLPDTAAASLSFRFMLSGKETCFGTSSSSSYIGFLGIARRFILQGMNEQVNLPKA